MFFPLENRPKLAVSLFPIIGELHVGGEEVVAVAVPLQALPPPVHVHCEALLHMDILHSTCISS